MQIWWLVVQITELKQFSEINTIFQIFIVSR